MQLKIADYFKSFVSRAPELPYGDVIDDPVLPLQIQHAVHVTYSRRGSQLISKRNEFESPESTSGFNRNTEICLSGSDQSSSCPEIRVLNKHKNYAQYHLEIGQSDFLLHNCSTCGIKYARGENTDEIFHRKFHQDYLLGLQCKGWSHERVVSPTTNSTDRIILILQSDSSSQRRKVEEVINFMKRDLNLSCTWLHDSCKVYLFISGKRIVGCVIVEPIRTAYRVLSASNELSTDATVPKSTDSKEKQSKSNTLQFGNICFQRECVLTHPSKNETEFIDDSGCILCEKQAVPAVCGIRAIWVAPSCRRKKIASHLLDAVRKNFCKGLVLEPSQCAFSQPTAVGRAFASTYCTTRSFLVYHTATANLRRELGLS